MTDLYSQFIKNASLQSPFYEEDDEFLAREEENKKRIEEEQRKIEELQKTEQEKLQDIQETIETKSVEPDSLYSQFIKNASELKSFSGLDDISASRKVKFGAAQEPTILGSLYRLSKAGVESLASDESFTEASQRIESERQEKIYQEFPEFYGREEDLTVLSGRMGVAVADPVTFFIPWVKIAKAGKLATMATGATVAGGEALLREKALYGEVSPTIVAASAGLGGASTAVGSLIANRLGSNKINQTVNSLDENGNVVKTKTIDASTPVPPTLNDKTVDELNIISREIYEENQPVIQSMSNNFESVGAAYSKIDLIKKENADIRNILTPHLHQMKQLRKNHIVFDAKNKIVFKPSKTINVKQGEKMYRQLQQNKKDLTGLKKEINQINFVKQPEDTAIVGVESLYKAYQKGLLEGSVGENLTKALVHELTRPLLGATSGGLVGIYLSDENTNESMYTGIAMGAFLGAFSKRLELSKYKLSENIKQTANNEAIKIFRESNMSSMKRLFASSHAAVLQSRNPILQKFGLDFLRNQGASLKTGQTLQDSVEELADKSFDHFKIKLFNSIGTSDNATIEAAGRLLQQRNMPSSAKSSFLKTGDLNNTKAKTLADELFKLNVSFKTYMRKAGVEFTEQDSYGLTQIFDRNKIDELGFDKVVSILKDSFKLQSRKYKGKKVPGFSKVDSKGNLLPIKVLTDKEAERLATSYITSSDNIRRQLVLDSDRLLDQDVMKSFIKNNGQVVDKNDTIIQSARFFENERVLFDQEARALAKDLFIQDPIATNLSLFDNSIRVAEFARKYGTKGQGIQDLKKQLSNYYSSIDKNWKTNSSLYTLYKNDLQDISNTVNGYFKVLDADRMPKGELQRSFILSLQTLLATTKLTKVALPSLGDTIQTIQNSGFKAGWNSAVRKITGGPKFSKELALRVEGDEGFFGRAFSGRQYNGALERELQNFSIDANNRYQKGLVEFQRKFFEVVQLGRVTRFAREFAYDAGAFRAFDLSKEAVRKGTLKGSKTRELDLMGLNTENINYLGKFKNIDEAYEDKIGKVLIDRAGRRSADRDALLPQIGNRRLFSQSKNPWMKLAGSFLSWAMAKGSQTNALVRRIEEGDGKLAMMMLGTLPLYATVRDLYVAVNPSKDFREDHGQFYSSLKEKDLEKLTEAMADSAVFSGQTMPWYLDKILNSFKFYGNDAIETIYPAAGLLNDLYAGTQTVGKGKFYTGGVDLVETVVPFGKDIMRSEVIGEQLTETGTTLKEAAKIKQEDIVPLSKYATGGLVKGKDNVPYTKEDPSDRVDPFTGSPYSDQMARLGLAEGGMAEDELLNFILATEDINLYRDYKQGNLDKEVIAHEGSKRFQEQHGKKDVSTIGGITGSGITKATVGETVGMVKERINKERQYLNQIIPEEKRINIPQSVQDSAVSLIFNVGQSAFKNSKAYQNLLDGDIQGYYREAFDPQQGFTKITGTDGTKQIDEGLVNRRRQELELAQNLWKAPE